MTKEFWIGTYENETQPSIYHCSYNPDEQVMNYQAVTDGLLNPSFFIRTEELLYTVEEDVPNGKVAALKLEEGKWQRKATLKAGSAPCHLSLDPERRYLFLTNYFTGGLIMYELDQAGIPIRQTHTVDHKPVSLPSGETLVPHFHFTAYRNEMLYVTDLGLGLISRFRIDYSQNSLIKAMPDIKFPEGAGCRHMVFHPDHEEMIYAVSEETAEVFVIREHENGGSVLQRISIQPEGFEGTKHAAAIKLTSDGKYLLASDRGSDAIAVYRVGEDGLLNCTDIWTNNLDGPRDFEVDGDHIIVTNQNSSKIVILKFDRNQGEILGTEHIASLKNPVYVMSLDKER